MIVEYTLKLGKRKIKLTQEEYDELRMHFIPQLVQDTPTYVPYPVMPNVWPPISPAIPTPFWPDYPIITCENIQ